MEQRIALLEKTVRKQAKQISALVQLIGADSLQDWDAKNKADKLVVTVTVSN